MSLPLSLDAASAVPLAEQLSSGLVGLIGDATLAAGDRLPSVRALATDLGVAPGTVAKVYRSMEQEGFLVTAGRHGTVVADQQPDVSAATRETVREALRPLLDGGASPAEVLRLVRSVLEE